MKLVNHCQYGLHLNGKVFFSFVIWQHSVKNAFINYLFMDTFRKRPQTVESLEPLRGQFGPLGADPRAVAERLDAGSRCLGQ